MRVSLHSRDAVRGAVGKISACVRHTTFQGRIGLPGYRPQAVMLNRATLPLVCKYGCLVHINRIATLVGLRMPAAVASAGPRVVARSDIRDAVDGLRQLEEGLSGLETLPAAQQSGATMAEQARVASAVAATAISARSQEPHGPVKAYQYRQPFSQPLARGTKEHKGSSSVRPSRGTSFHGLQIGRLRDGCTKLCFSPIGVLLLICSFSLLFCVAQIFSPPPFGINLGPDAAECNATGFEPMPICICVPPLL